MKKMRRKQSETKTMNMQQKLKLRLRSFGASWLIAELHLLSCRMLETVYKSRLKIIKVIQFTATQQQATSNPTTLPSLNQAQKCVDSL